MVIFRPDYFIDGDITDIDLDRLEKDGLRGLILDLDSTLMAPRAGMLTPEAEQWLNKARLQFKVAVVSNNHRDAYLKNIARDLDMTVIGNAFKPCRKSFFIVLNEFQLQASEVAVVGDRPLTDVWGGQRAGMKTVLVRPLKTIVEPSWKTSIRNLERLLARR